MTIVEPDKAVAAMTKLWRGLGNEISSPLLSTWRTMCDALNQAGQAERSVAWTALAMPTGIGKTQFAALYCALMPNPTLSADNLESVNLHPGVLFVTRFITEANKFAEQVNKYAGRKVAAAYYHNSPVSLSDAIRFPVLVITHAACERHQLLDRGATNRETTWDHLTAWNHGRRAKIIIDETPNFITAVQIDENWLSHTLAALKWQRSAPKGLYLEMELLLKSITDTRHDAKHRPISGLEFEHIEYINVAKIREHLSSVEDRALTLECGPNHTLLRRICNQTLSAIEVIQINGWAWLSYRGQSAQINSAALHPSLRSGSGVILDGTAIFYPGYNLLSPPAKVISAPANVRSYDNVTLYVARGHKAGKAYFSDNAPKLWTQYRAAIESKLPNAERVLICSHKQFREKVDVTPLPRISFAHYGDIDGRNDWKDYEAVALLGLPYLDGATPTNIAQSLLGPQASEWLQTPALRRSGQFDDVVTALHRGHMCASAVQAISRVRCRAAIDSLGHCRPASVFVALPNGEDGDAVLSAIIRSMPGVQVTPWKVNTAKRKQRAVPASDAVVRFFVTAPTSVYTKAQVRAATGISPTSLDRVIQRLNRAASAERLQFDDLRVTYYQQLGQGAQSYFVKA